MNIRQELPRKAKPGEPTALDLEMFGQDLRHLHRPHGEFACLSIGFSDDEVYQIYTLEDLVKSLELVKQGSWTFQKALYDIRQLRQFVDIPKRPVWDTMIVEQDIFGGYYDSFGLDDLARRWYATYVDKAPRGKFANATRMTREMKIYAAKDVVHTLGVREKQEQHIHENDLPFRHYLENDANMIWVVLDMPAVRIDTDGWIELAEENKEHGFALQEELGFNVKSWQQTQKEIADHIGKDEYTKSTDKDHMQELMDEYPEEKEWFEAVLEARRFRDAFSRYGPNWIENFVEPGGLVYGNWRITGSETGRLTCSNPPLQTVPVRNMPRFRELFIPRAGHKMIVADFSQQETRILAWFSDDANLKRALAEGRDLHQETADDFDLEDRFEGKTINLALGYGLTARGLVARTGMSMKRAEAGIQRRNARYPEAAVWMNKMQITGFNLGYVTNSIGRQIYLNPYSGQLERNAINAPIQSTAADQLKMMTVYMHKQCQQRDLPFCVVLMIHDEVVCDVPEDLVEDYVELIHEAAEYAAAETVPGMEMPIEPEVGDSWGVKQ